MIVRVIDGVVTQIPLKQVKKEYPNTSFPDTLVVGQDYRTEYDFHVVDVKDKPVISAGQRVVPLEIVMVDGVYTQQYVALDVVVSTDPRDYNLTPYRFKRFLRDGGRYKVVDAVLGYLEYNDYDAFLLYSAELQSRSEYRFSVMLGFMALPEIKILLRDDVDLTEETLSSAWLLAKDY